MLNRLLPFLLIGVVASSAGQATITGKVTTATGETLPGASVLLKNHQNEITSFAICNTSGAYSLGVRSTGSFTLEASFLGFQTKTIPLVVTPDDATLTRDFVLEEGGIEIREVVIESEFAVKRRGDTLVYNANALKTGHETVVEDLLKNIPGVTIDDNGVIRFGDQAIEKVMVDGDDLFSKGYPVLTRNMPVEPVAKVEILQNYSNNRLLKGVEDSNKVALNLELSEEYRNIWFGNATVGYGNRDRYKTSSNLMNFSRSFKSFYTVSMNNAGLDYSGAISEMDYNPSDIETIGLGYRASEILHLTIARPPLDPRRSLFNHPKTGTFSTLFAVDAKTKVRLNGAAAHDNLASFQNSEKSFEVEGTHFVNREVQHLVSRTDRLYFSALVTSDLSASQMLQSKTAFNTGRLQTDSRLIFNGLPTREELFGQNTYFDQQLNYSHRWNERNVMILKSRFLLDERPQRYGIDEYLLGNLFTGSFDGIANTTDSRMTYAGLQADFKLRKSSGNLIGFTVGLDHSSERIDAAFRLLQNGNQTYPEDFQADSRYRIYDWYASTGYQWQVGKVAFGGSTNVHLLLNHFENDKGASRSQQPFLMNLAINGIWSWSPNSNLRLTSQYNRTNGGILSVNDRYLLTSSRGFSRGLSDFSQLGQASASIAYSTKHYLNRHGFTLTLDHSRQLDDVTYQNTLTPNYALSDAFMIRGGHQNRLYFISHRVFRKLKGTLGLNANASETVYYNQVNTSGLRRNVFYSQRYGVNWISTFKGNFNFEWNSKWQFSKVRSFSDFSSVAGQEALTLRYLASERMTFETRLQHFYFNGEGGDGQHYQFADAEVFYTFKDDRYTLGLEARNLFDTRHFESYTVSDFGSISNSFHLLPTYVLMSFKFKF